MPYDHPIETDPAPDLLVVDGDPVSDIGVLRDADALLAVLLGGRAVTDRLDTLAAAPGHTAG